MISPAKNKSRLSPKGEKRLVLNLCFFLFGFGGALFTRLLATPQEVLSSRRQEV
jgi:hypothetical protein